MKVEHLQYHESKWSIIPKQDCSKQTFIAQPDLILAFLSPSKETMAASFEQLRLQYTNAIVIGCSTGGQIQDSDYFDKVSVATAIKFDHSTVKLASIKNEEAKNSFQSGIDLAKQLNQDGLRGVLILSEGLNVNGSALIKGLKAALPTNTPISGGLAGDGANFSKTLVGANSTMQSGLIAAVGFYGERIRLDHSYGGGWRTFGPQREITRSTDNILYELDGEPALTLYKRYLGDEAEQLPSSALLYPLKIWDVDPETGQTQELVRTVLSIDEDNKSMTFAGNMPQGSTAQLMLGSYDNLIQGASRAAKSLNTSAKNTQNEESDTLAILVSCIGRKLMLGQHVYEEIEEVDEALGDHISKIGFYSYGELCPHINDGASELHNQTMTITLLTEQ